MPIVDKSDKYFDVVVPVQVLIYIACVAGVEGEEKGKRSA